MTCNCRGGPTCCINTMKSCNCTLDYDKCCGRMELLNFNAKYAKMYFSPFVQEQIYVTNITPIDYNKDIMYHQEQLEFNFDD